MNGLGAASRDSGHSRVPAPPARIMGMIMVGQVAHAGLAGLADVVMRRSTLPSAACRTNRDRRFGVRADRCVASRSLRFTSFPATIPRSSEWTLRNPDRERPNVVPLPFLAAATRWHRRRRWGDSDRCTAVRMRCKRCTRRSKRSRRPMRQCSSPANPAAARSWSRGRFTSAAAARADRSSRSTAARFRPTSSRPNFSATRRVRSPAPRAAAAAASSAPKAVRCCSTK